MNRSSGDSKASPALEKDFDLDLRVEEVSPPPELAHGVSYSGDEALPSPPILTREEEKRLWRKIDWHIVPIVTIMYLCSFVDRSNIGASSILLDFCRSLTRYANCRECQATRHYYTTKPDRR